MLIPSVLLLASIVAAAPASPRAAEVTFWAIWLLPLYVAYQHLRMKQLKRRLNQQEVLFRLISENAADMIAVVDLTGHRLYNSPAYEKVLGYSSRELRASSAYQQIHLGSNAGAVTYKKLHKFSGLTTARRGMMRPMRALELSLRAGQAVKLQSRLDAHRRSQT